MITHIVLWKLKDRAEGADKQTNIKLMKALLEGLPGKIPQVKKFEVGENCVPGEGSWDLALYSTFESEADLAIYQKHPEHLKVVEFVGKVRESRAVVDYQC
jgi:hypothetical protein